MPADPTSVVRDFCAAWSRLDVDAICAYFADDAEYFNIPMQPLRGLAAIRAALQGFVGAMQSAEFEIKQIAGNGNSVLTERIDRFQLGARAVEIPVMGIFELRDAKIVAWRDYFDLAMYERQLKD